MTGRTTRWPWLLLSMALLAAIVGIAGWWLGIALSWRDEDLLWLLLLVLPFTALPVAAWQLRQRATRRFGNPATARGLVVGRSAGWRAARAVLFISGLALLVIALAGPQYGSRTRMLRKRGIDVVIALDFSKSMLAQDVRPNRIRRAKAEIQAFVAELQGDRIGLVAFAGDTMEFPMTVDYAALGLFLRDLGPYDMPVGGTALGRALVASQRLLERSSSAPRPDQDEQEREQERSQIVILFTDGEDHEGDPEEAARGLAEAGIRVYTIGIGSRTGEPIPTYSPDGTWTGYMRDEEGNTVKTNLTEENENTLREVARLTGGRYFRARQGSVGVAQIAEEMKRMKQSEREARRVTVNEDRYALVLLPAFLFILLESLLPEAFVGRRRRKARLKRMKTRPATKEGT